MFMWSFGLVSYRMPGLHSTPRCPDIKNYARYMDPKGRMCIGIIQAMISGIPLFSGLKTRMCFCGLLGPYYGEVGDVLNLMWILALKCCPRGESQTRLLI